MQLLEDVKKLLGFADDIQLARHLGKDKSTISKWRSAGEIPARAERELNKILLSSAPTVPTTGQGQSCGSCGTLTRKQQILLELCNEEVLLDEAIKHAEEKKLLKELLKERAEKEAA